MDRFRELETFVAVAEQAGFKAAARALNLSPPSVTRMINSLEARLGARLFNRTTRLVALTEAGERLLADAQRILAEVDAAEDSAAGAHQSPQGLLRVTAPVMFGQLHVAPILRDFLDAHPDVTASTLFVNRVVDLIEEGLDVAVRIGPLPDSTLTAVRVGTVRRVLVAAPGYLERHPPPVSLDDLRHHRLIRHVGSEASPDWRFSRAGSIRPVPVAPALTANTVTTCVDAAVAGWGVTRLLSYQVAEALADGTLVEVLAGTDDRDLPIHLVHPGGRASAAKVRAFVDFAARRLRAETGWT